MKQFTLLLILGIIIESCCAERIQPDSISGLSNISETNQPVFYQSSTGNYFIHQNDPFSLSNIQAAYDYLASSEYANKTYPGAFTKGTLIQATHYALKVFPKTLEEQYYLEGMDDIQISYHPFNCVPVSKEEGFKADIQEKIVLEKSPYVMTINGVSPEDVDYKKNVVMEMPILYIVWPIEKNLPNNIDFVIDYEVFLPQASPKTKTNLGLSREIQTVLEDEALYLALGKRLIKNRSVPQTKQLREEEDSSNFKVMTGQVTCYDYQYDETVPVGGITMRYELGTLIIDAHTTTNGYYDITIDTIYHPYMNFSFYFKSYSFFITYNNSPNIFKDSYGTVPSVFGPDLYSHRDFSLSETHPILPVFRGARYFFAGNHGITIPEAVNRPIKINVIPTFEDNLGEFYPIDNNPYIKIYNYYDDYNTSFIIGTTIHELGHYFNFILKGEENEEYQLLPKIVRESFASYIGWLIGGKYYNYLGHYFTDEYNPTGQGRQNWTQYTSGALGRYSPLFIDLYDSFNQNPSYSYDAPNDEISGTPSLAIIQAIYQAGSWTGLRSILNSYINVYYSQTDFTNFIYSFDYWYSHYNN